MFYTHPIDSSSYSGVSSIAIRLYAKMLTNVSPFCTKEAFVSLTTAIVGLYKDKSRNYQLPSMASEVSFKKRPTQNLLQICRLLTQTCKDLPRFWNRYPPSHIEEIMKAMLELVTLKSRGQKVGFIVNSGPMRIFVCLFVYIHFWPIRQHKSYTYITTNQQFF